MNKKISVCIATYNGEKYIKEQIESILFQTIQPNEIIISDDNSTDKTIEIIKKINSPLIKIFRNKDKGIIKNFENALLNSTGDYIFLCDQDDIWKNNKIEKVIENLKNYDLVVHNAEIKEMNTNLKVKKTLFEIYNSKSGIGRNFYKNSYVGCCMAFNRKILEKSIPFPEKIYMHDAWIGMISEVSSKIYFEKESLMEYRRHGNNASETCEKSKRNFKEKIRIRLYLLKELIKNILKSVNRKKKDIG